MKIGNHEIYRGAKPFVIAEVAQSHDGSLGQALAFVDIAAECGADAIKFQTHIASEESTPDEPWRIKFSHQDNTRYAYWERMSFEKSWWQIIKRRAEEAGLVFLSSPFSELAVEWLEDLDIQAWKIASGEVHNERLLRAVEATKKPIIISTGLSDTSTSTDLVSRFQSKGICVGLVHCTTMYPTPPEAVGMNIYENLRKHFDSSVPVGLSDHSGSPIPSIIASYLGASIIEVHLTMHKKMFGPDVSSSLDPQGLKALVEGVYFAWAMSVSPVIKHEQLEWLEPIKNIFTRSLVYNQDLVKGHVLCDSDLGYKKPGGGLSDEITETLVGRVLRHDVVKDSLTKLSDVEPLPGEKDSSMHHGET